MARPTISVCIVSVPSHVWIGPEETAEALDAERLVHDGRSPARTPATTSPSSTQNDPVIRARADGR
jgi:hypothetical protein